MKLKLYIFSFLMTNLLFANVKSELNPPNFSISYNSPGCIVAGNVLQVTVIDNSGGGVPYGTYSATPAGLVIDPDTGDVNAGASLPGNYIITYNFTTATRSTTLDLLNSITPTFNSLGNICQNSVAPVLPTFSANLVSGTWFPAVINTAALGTINYVFTPNSGQCGQSINIDVTISIPTTTPTFNIANSFCKNTLIASLPTMSTNGVSGSWTPSSIDTATAGQSTYIFTGIGQCIANYSLVVTIIEPTVPDFQNIEINNNYQAIPTLNSTSPNGVSGTWNVAAINPTQSGTYVFTANSGQCATNQTISVSVIYPQANVPPVLQTCGNGNGFGNFQLLDNDPFINPSTNPQIIVEYYETLAAAQSIFSQPTISTIGYTNTTAFNQTIYAKVKNFTIASRPYSIVPVQLKVSTSLQPAVTANYANIYVDDFDNVIQPVTLSTVFQGTNFYAWYEGILPLVGGQTPDYTVNNFAGLVLRTFKVKVTKQFNQSCEGFSNTVTIGTVRVGAPFGNTTQYYNAGQTLANLVVSGSNIRWYSSQTGSAASLLPITTLLTNGTTYYASQTIDGVQSPNVLGVTAILNLANENFNVLNLKFSPNPVNDFLNIQSQEIIKNISILNVLGQEVYSQKFNDLDIKIDLSGLISGNYIMKIETDNKQMISKIIKN